MYNKDPYNSSNNDYIYEEKMKNKVVRRQYNHCGKALIGYFVLTQIFSILMKFLQSKIPYGEMPEIYQVISLMGTLIINLLPFVICAKLIKFNYKTIIGNDKISWNLICGGVAVVFASNFVINITMQMIQSMLGDYGLFMDTFSPEISSNLVENIVLFLLVVIVAPITEEFIFRGVLFSGFSKFGGNTFAIVITSILFSLLHGNFIQAIPAFVIGLILGYLRAKTGSVKSSIILHGLNNAYSYIMIWFQFFAKDFFDNPQNYTTETILSLPTEDVLKAVVVSGFSLVSFAFIVFCIGVTVYIFSKRIVTMQTTTVQERRNGYKLLFTSWSIIGVLIINVINCIISIKALG